MPGQPWCRVGWEAPSPQASPAVLPVLLLGGLSRLRDAWRPLGAWEGTAAATGAKGWWNYYTWWAAQIKKFAHCDEK